MDDLTKYIFDHYAHLMASEEKAAYKSLFGLRKAANLGDESQMQDFVRRKWVSSDPEVLRLLEAGGDEFKKSVVERILRDGGNKVFIDRCAKCGALARGPNAKQCPQCFHSGHEESV